MWRKRSAKGGNAGGPRPANYDKHHPFAPVAHPNDYLSPSARVKQGLPPAGRLPYTGRGRRSYSGSHSRSRSPHSQHHNHHHHHRAHHGGHHAHGPPSPRGTSPGPRSAGYGSDHPKSHVLRSNVYSEYSDHFYLNPPHHWTSYLKRDELRNGVTARRNTDFNRHNLSNYSDQQKVQPSMAKGTMYKPTRRRRGKTMTVAPQRGYSPSCGPCTSSQSTSTWLLIATIVQIVLVVGAMVWVSTLSDKVVPRPLPFMLQSGITGGFALILVIYGICAQDRGWLLTVVIAEVALASSSYHFFSYDRYAAHEHQVPIFVVYVLSAALVAWLAFRANEHLQDEFEFFSRNAGRKISNRGPSLGIANNPAVLSKFVYVVALLDSVLAFALIAFGFKINVALYNQYLHVFFVALVALVGTAMSVLGTLRQQRPPLIASGIFHLFCFVMVVSYLPSIYSSGYQFAADACSAAVDSQREIFNLCIEQRTTFLFIAVCYTVLFVTKACLTWLALRMSEAMQSHVKLFRVGAGMTSAYTDLSQPYVCCGFVSNHFEVAAKTMIVFDVGLYLILCACHFVLSLSLVTRSLVVFQVALGILSFLAIVTVIVGTYFNLRSWLILSVIFHVLSASVAGASAFVVANAKLTVSEELSGEEEVNDNSLQSAVLASLFAHVIIALLGAIFALLLQETYQDIWRPDRKPAMYKTKKGSEEDSDARRKREAEERRRRRNARKGGKVVASSTSAYTSFSSGFDSFSRVTSSSDSHSSILKSYGSHFDMSSNELSQVGLQPRYAKGHHRRR